MSESEQPKKPKFPNLGDLLDFMSPHWSLAPDSDYWIKRPYKRSFEFPPTPETNVRDITVTFTSWPEPVETTPEMQEAARKLAERVAQKIQSKMFGDLVFQPTEIHPYHASIEVEALLNQMKAMQVEWDAKDPLLQKGVQRDWVCIINKNTYYRLEEIARRQPPLIWGITMDAGHITGRRTHVVDEAPDGLEYMTEETARRLYPAFFAKLDAERLEMLAQLGEDLQPLNLEDDEEAAE